MRADIGLQRPGDRALENRANRPGIPGCGRPSPRAGSSFHGGDDGDLGPCPDPRRPVRGVRDDAPPEAGDPLVPPHTAVLHAVLELLDVDGRLDPAGAAAQGGPQLLRALIVAGPVRPLGAGGGCGGRAIALVARPAAPLL